MRPTKTSRNSESRVATNAEPRSAIRSGPRCEPRAEPRAEPREELRFRIVSAPEKTHPQSALRVTARNIGLIPCGASRKNNHRRKSGVNLDANRTSYKARCELQGTSARVRRPPFEIDGPQADKEHESTFRSRSPAESSNENLASGAAPYQRRAYNGAR